MNAVFLFIKEQILVLTYYAISLSCWSIVFCHIYPRITQQSQSLATLTTATFNRSDETFVVIATYHQYIGVCVFLACMITYRMAAKSSPGIVTPTTVQYYNHYPYDEYMYFPPPTTTVMDNQETKMTTTAKAMKTTTTTMNSGISNTTPNESQPIRQSSTQQHPLSQQYQLKVPRSKYDRIKYVNCIIPKYDHYCVWMHNTYGEENYRYFLLFLLVHVCMCWYGSTTITRLLYNEIYIIHQLHLQTFIDRNTNEIVPMTQYILFQYVFHTYIYEMTVLLILYVMFVTLFLFLAYHVYITSRGLTSHEMYKWSHVQQWYKSELQLYQKQQQQQELKLRRKEPNLKYDDTTTTMTMVEHPGPKPFNLYNYGIVQNWKHVLFPISIQRRHKLQVRQQEQQLRQQQLKSQGIQTHIQKNQ
jgi:DHHC palmitoyltransferase